MDPVLAQTQEIEALEAIYGEVRLDKQGPMYTLALHEAGLLGTADRRCRPCLKRSGGGIELLTIPQHAA